MSEGPMSAPPQSPGPYRYSGAHCSCARCRIRGLRTPVILITIGALFMLAQMVPQVHFRNLWPIILIVIGVVMLLESTASTEGHRG